MKIFDSPIAIAGGIAFLLVLIAGLVSYKFTEQLSLFLVVVGMILLGSISRIPERFAGDSFGFELGVFLTICTGFALGPKIALLVGIPITILAAYLVNQAPQDLVAALFMISITGLLAGIFKTAFGLLPTGMLFVFIYDLMCLLSYTILGHTLAGGAKFLVSHLVWNYVLFSAIGESVIQMLGAI